MYYTEFLRTVRALRVVGIILGIFLVLGIAMRVATLWNGSPDTWVNAFKAAPGAVVHETKLADGSTKTTVDNASKHTHVVEFDYGNRGKKITIVEPSSYMAAKGEYNVNFGSTNRTDDGTTRRISVDTTARINLDMSLLFAVATFLGLLTATLVSCTLGKENDGHLELAWTKPASREVYALTAIGVDVAAILAAEVATVLVFLLLLALFPGPTLTWLPTTGAVLLAAILGPTAWYAMLTMASASLKRGFGAVIGTAWPVAVTVPGLAIAYFGESPIGQGAHQVFRAINFFNPIGYLQLHGAGHNDISALTVQNSSTALPILAILTIVYLALAVAQWRRVEA